MKNLQYTGAVPMRQPRSSTCRGLLALAPLALCGCLPGAIYGQIDEAVPDRPDLTLTSLRVAVHGGLSDEIRLDVPPSLQSALVDLSGSRGAYRLATVIVPSGFDLVESGSLITRDARTVPGQVDWLLPNSPRITVEPGRYRARFSALSTGAVVDSDEVQVRIYSRHGTAALRRCSLELDLLVPQEAVRVVDVERSAAQLVSILRAIYAQVDVSIGEPLVRTVAFDSPDLVITGANVQGSALEAVRRALDGARPGALHILFTRTLTNSRQNPVRAYSLGLPGPFAPDRLTSAVIVAADSFTDLSGGLDIAGLAETVAHEMGHYLGLYHTSEDGGLLFDPIPDTPECPDGSPCPDIDNIMFRTGIGRRIFTPMQGAVIRAHPLCAPR